MVQVTSHYILVVFRGLGRGLRSPSVSSFLIYLFIYLCIYLLVIKCKERFCLD